MSINWAALGTLWTEFFPANSAAVPLPAPAVVQPATLPVATVASASAMLSAVSAFLAAHAPVIATADAAAEDIAELMAIVGVPGAAVAAGVIPLAPQAVADLVAFLPILGSALAMLQAAPVASPISPDSPTQFSRGR